MPVTAPNTRLIPTEDPTVYRATTMDGTTMGNLIDTGEDTWMAQPADERFTTTSGFPGPREAVEYLAESHISATTMGSEPITGTDQEWDNYTTIRSTLRSKDWRNGMRSHTVNITTGQRSWNPASTKPDAGFPGPATIVYTEYQDGGIHASVTA